MLHNKTRQAQESRIRNILSKLNKKKRDEIVKLLGNPPNIKNIPVSFWTSLEDDTTKLLLLLLISIYESGSRRIESAVGRNLDETDRLQISTTYAEDRANRVAKSFAKNVKKRLDNALGKPENTKTQAATKRAVTKVIGNQQAEDIAITESTEAAASGEIGAVNKIRKGQFPDTLDNGPFDKPPEIIITWITEADAKVCPICKPLHLQPESVWRRFFPDGPAAHPRCRCDLGYQVDGRTVSGKEKPKDKLTILQAFDRLAARNYTLGKAVGDDGKGKTLYRVKGPDGKTVTMTTQEIRSLI